MATQTANRKIMLVVSLIGFAATNLWLAAVRDAFSNRIVGWKTSDRCDTDLVLGALEYGVWSRDVRDGQLILLDKLSLQHVIGDVDLMADSALLSWDPVAGDEVSSLTEGDHRRHRTVVRLAARRNSCCSSEYRRGAARKLLR
ncbi:hypothetical protein [Nocardia australiensis]|uniref:hypothetical protein n=1 Tax=Nocardia australiensis TaxID=2887191 RepID=UPI001D13B550|nr:hypothetical protein [Nocardia australiensis]